MHPAWIMPLALCASGAAAEVRTVIVRHGLGHPRPGSVVEVPFEPLRLGPQVRVRDARGRILRSQLLDLDGDGRTDRLLFLADLPATGATRFRVERGQARTDERVCWGRHVPERKDDVAWENDRVAFRVYGPALAATLGEVSGSGVDVWSKRVNRPVIDRWYVSGDYHVDHGEGLDAYKVGTSRGCGGTGVIAGDALHAAGVWLHQRVLTTGPLRVVLELAYAPYAAGPAIVTESKRISLDRGSHLFRVETRLRVEGAAEVAFAAGLVRRRGEEPPRSGQGWVARFEPAGPHGSIGTALILPEGRLEVRADHALLVRVTQNGESVVHHAGACWDQSGAHRNLDGWTQAVSQEAARLASPLHVTIE